MHPLGTQHGMLAYNSSSPRFFSVELRLPQSSFGHQCTICAVFLRKWHRIVETRRLPAACEWSTPEHRFYLFSLYFSLFSQFEGVMRLLAVGKRILDPLEMTDLILVSSRI